MPDQNNRRRGTRFREAVALYLAARGIPASVRPFRKLSQDLAEDAPQADVLGIDGWALAVRDARSARLPTLVDDAAEVAEHDRADRWALVLSRQGRAVPDAYAVLTLAALADVLADGQPPLETRVEP